MLMENYELGKVGLEVLSTINLQPAPTKNCFDIEVLAEYVFGDMGEEEKKAVNKYPQNDYDIHFGNLSLVSKSIFADIKDIASERGLNRVNYLTGKARDYFKVWEVDDEDFWKFHGVITVNEQKKTAEQLKQLEQLLRDSLGFVDKLCGAICRITTEKEDADASRQSPPSTGNGNCWCC
ncbi:MAG TPA: hypothetical protein VJ440_00535 [Candidatus Brocadiaceae bacterium]|nr:hypothetical protein [Candidatus Brocadiaceae bacterium]